MKNAEVKGCVWRDAGQKCSESGGVIVSRRIVVYEICPHAECEEYTSISRGFVTRTIICRHPENEACICVRALDADAECPWYEQGSEESPESRE